MLLTIEFLAAPADIDIINSETLPITYSVCCVFEEVADNSTTHKTLLFCTRRKALFLIDGGKQVRMQDYRQTALHSDTDLRPSSLDCLGQANGSSYVGLHSSSSWLLLGRSPVYDACCSVPTAHKLVSISFVQFGSAHKYKTIFAT